METPTHNSPPVASADLFGWVKTADRLPGEIGEQTDVLMWSPGWATWLKGMATRWIDGSVEWAIYNQQDDRYHEWEYPPEFWMSPILPNAGAEARLPDSAASATQNGNERPKLSDRHTGRWANQNLMRATQDAQAGSLERVVRRGWRHFHCAECEHRWKWPSRDAMSPSGENCPRCDEWCHPYHGELDATIPCDDMGNLTVPWNWDGHTPNESR